MAMKEMRGEKGGYLTKLMFQPMPTAAASDVAIIGPKAG